MPVILSYIQTRPLLEARRRGQAVVETSLDLGISNTSITLSAEGVSFATGERLDWASVEKISRSEVNCYPISAQGMQSVQTFSQETNRLCSLLPTRGAPSMRVYEFKHPSSTGYLCGCPVYMIRLTSRVGPIHTWETTVPWS